MSELLLDTREQFVINFAPTETDEIMQNVRMIILSAMKTCPMHRSFAWDGGILDRPINVVQSILGARLIAAVNQYEPRAELTGVTFAGDGASGLLMPIAKVRIKNAQ